MRKTLFTMLMLFAVSAIAHLQAAKYKNPIIAEDAPDPSIIKGNDGYYYLFSTAEHVYCSTDMVHWKYLRQVFDGGKRPTFVEGVDVYWAPCVTKQDGRYVMYFALSKWGGGKTASIGVATAAKPEGPYFIAGEEGKLFTSAEIGVENSIDPNYIEDNGRKYLVWGSWNGIWLVELTADGLAVKNASRKREIAGTRFEAPYIYKRGRYYYLFCSIGACCEGERSTYETVVGRSTSIMGPYTTRNGKRMLDNEYTLFLTSNDPCIAPGHNSRILEDETGRTWMTYHGYMRSNPDKGRVAWLDEVKWTSNGWPYIEGTGASSTELEAPVVAPFSLDVDKVYASWGVEEGTLVPVDLNNEGQLSLVVAGHRTNKEGAVTPWNAVLRRGDDGQWTTAPNGLQTGVHPAVVPADFDGDGSLELVVLSEADPTYNPDGAANGVYYVQPDSTLRLEGEALADLTAAAVADVNGDGHTDIIAVGPHGKNVILYSQRSAKPFEGSPLTFRQVPFAGADVSYSQVLTADFNADGHPDIFTYSATSAELFLQDFATGAFIPVNWMTTCPVPTDGGVAVADVNNDSALDIICVGDQGTLCLNDGEGHFAPSASSGLELDGRNGNFSASAANLFDLNGDGNADFLYQGQNEAFAAATGAVWQGSSKGSFTHRRRYGAGASAATTFLDWNVDGLPDLVTTGKVDDSHLFPRESGYLLSVSYNPYTSSSTLQPPTGLESHVEGSMVYLTWNRGLKNHTYEIFVRDDQGRLYGNVRSFVDGDFAGRRKVLAPGNSGTATEAVMKLPAGHYTWGVQRLNGRMEASRFSTAEFTVEFDGISEPEANSKGAAAQAVRFNLLGQRVSASQRGILLLRYPDGSVRKTIRR